MSGRHRPRGLLGLRPSLRAPLAIVGIVGLVTVTAVALQTVTAGADGCSTGGIRVSVAADSSIAPVVRDVAAEWGRAQPEINGRCVRIDVTAAASADVASALGSRGGGQIDVAAKPAPTPSEGDVPDVWIPDSTFWLSRVRTVDRDAFELDAPSVATSPVVLGVRESDQALLAGIKPPVSAKAVRTLLGSDALKLGLAEPRRETASLVGAMLLRDAVVSRDAELPKLVGLFRRLGGGAPDTATLLKAFDQGLNVAPVSEQALLQHDAAEGATQLAAVGIQDSPTLDYPYAILAGKPREISAAAQRFRAALLSGDYAETLARQGFRNPDGSAAAGFPAGHGVEPATVAVTPVTDTTRAEGTLHVWVAATRPSRVLALVDVTASMSGTMTGPRGNTEVRLNVLRQAATDGLQLFTNDSELGMWAYAANLDGPRDYLPVVPIGKLDSAQRDRIQTAVTRAQPVPTNACGLFETLLAAYTSMKDGYNPDTSNTIVVFTDGRSDKPGGLTLTEFQRELEQQADVTRPIRVVLLGIGPDVDMTQLRAVAETTGGVAFQVNDPAEISTIFLKALLA